MPKRVKRMMAIRDKALIEELIKKYGFTPLDVMLENAQWAVKKSKDAEKKLATARTEKDKFKAAADLRYYRSHALNAVNSAAPYMHARLQATELSNDPDNPITTPDLVVSFADVKTNNSDT